MDTYVKKSDVKRVIDHLVAGAQVTVKLHPDDDYANSLVDAELTTLKLAWSLIDVLKTYNRNGNGKERNGSRSEVPRVRYDQ